MAAEQLDVIPNPDDPFGQQSVEYCLQICGFTQPAQRNGWIDEGMATMADICTFRPKEVCGVGSNLQKLSVNRGGSRQGRAQLSKLEALVRWCLQRRSSGLNLDATEFTVDVMMEIVENIRLEKEVQDQGEEIAMDQIPSFKPMKWVSWKLAFTTMLSSTPSIMENLPLSYVTRSATVPSETERAEMPDDQQRLWSVILRGTHYQSDNKTVYRKLKLALLDTEGWVWIQQFDATENGRSAWLSLLAHYDGPGEREKRIATAKGTLKNLYYQNERGNVNFEKHSSRMFDAFTILEENGILYQPFEKVDKLLEGIDQGAPQMIHNAKTVIRLDDNMKNDFTLACNKLSEFISKETIPSTSTRIGGGRNISSYRGRGPPRSGRAQRGRGRGRGQRYHSRLNSRPRYQNSSQLLQKFPGANPNDTRTTVNGVDVRDANTEFTQEQYQTLINAAYVPTLKYCRAVLRQKQGGNTSSSVASIRTQNESLTRRLAAVEGILNAQQSNDSPNNVGDETLTVDSCSMRPNSSSNGSQFGSGAYKRPKISGLTSVQRIQQIKASKAHGSTKTDTRARMESDSHADTCALGSNFLLVETTEWTCTVQPFHEDYAAQEDIPVVTGATAYDDPDSGETVILIFHQSLWFGPSLENSLICPQQI